MTEPKGWSNDQKKLVFNTVAKGLSPADQALFEAVCLSSGLDPLRKEIYAVVRSGKMAIQTGIDGYLKLANQTKELNGMEVLFYDAEGHESEVWLNSSPPAACLVRVYRKGAEYPFTASCRFDAYSQNNHMWKKFPETMLAKATTTLALRRGFADVIAGIASADEMDQAGLADPEALAQGTPVAAPKQPAPGSLKKVAKKAPPATPRPDPAAEVAKASEDIASAMNGTVLEPDDPEVVASKARPTADDLRAVGAERGLTTHAIEGILELINGDFEQGISTINSKSPEDIKKLNQRFAPPAKIEGW
jgi:phage recombination protein Bet|tara:strand:+ start:899 stop:1813 length:915 start_codon:yes stop_codon:yes gene_type:complete